jgi:hypothetical protein
MTAHDAIHFQNSSSAWPFSRHDRVSPPSWTKKVASMSV